MSNDEAQKQFAAILDEHAARGWKVGLSPRTGKTKLALILNFVAADTLPELPDDPAK